MIEKQSLTAEESELLEPEITVAAVPETSVPVLSLKEEETKPEETNSNSHSHSHSGLRETFKKHSAGFILFSVLALESFISGSALGIAGQWLGVVVLLIAILTHIWAEAFALSKICS